MAIIGAIIGDIVGSQYEFKKPDNFDSTSAQLLSDKCNFTDDTVLSIATMYALVHNMSFVQAYQFFGLKYPNVGYGNLFLDWLRDEFPKPYGSYGNGSAMRVSSIADYFKQKDKVIEYAIKSAECTHNHPEGIKGAVTTAVCVWMAKKGYTREDILKYAIEQYPRSDYSYSADLTLDEIKKKYKWDVTCQGSVPVAIRCVCEADSYTGFIRNVLSLNCDADTLCAIGGGIAEELFDNTNDELMKASNKILNMYLDDYLKSILFEYIHCGREME